GRAGWRAAAGRPGAGAGPGLGARPRPHRAGRGPAAGVPGRGRVARAHGAGGAGEGHRDRTQLDDPGGPPVLVVELVGVVDEPGGAEVDPEGQRWLEVGQEAGVIADAEADPPAVDFEV